VLVVSIMANSLRPDGHIARQTPLSVGFSRQDTEVGCLAFLHGIIPTQELNQSLKFPALDKENHEKPLTAGTRTSSLGLIQNHTAGLGCPQLSNCLSAELEGLVAYLFTDSYSQILTVCLERQ